MQHSIVLSWNSFFDCTLFHPIGFMWFLPVLFMIFVMIFPWWKCITKMQLGKRNILVAILLTIVVVIMLYEWLPRIGFMQISASIYYARYFLLGILYCEYKSTIDDFFYRYPYVIIPIFFCISVSLLTKGFIAASCGIVFSLGLALILSHKCGEMIVRLSKCCYTVFLLSYFPQMLITRTDCSFFSNVN